jgi:hypothetical protein
VAKFIQICASQNDVFALDDTGDVFRYNFSAKTWVRLIADRHPEDETADPRAVEHS